MRTRARDRSILMPALLAVWMLPSAGACQITLDDVLSQTRVPGTGSKAELDLEARRFGYLDTRVATGTYELRFFLPEIAECEGLFRTDDEITYQYLGPLGRLKYGEEAVCEPAGMLDLRVWRNRRPRGTATRRQLVPRAQSVFDEIDRDEDFVLLEGRFPLAGQIGWVGGNASRALVPNDDRCREIVEAGVASMEYREAGRVPFSLVGAKGLCPIEGFVRADR